MRTNGKEDRAVFFIYLYNGNRSLRLYYLVHDYPISYTITLSRTRIIPSRTRFQGRPGWAFCCKRSKNVRMSTNEETARTIIRVREAEKSHGIRTFSKGRGAKKKDPNCIRIRVLLWQISAIRIPLHPTFLLGCISGQVGCISGQAGCIFAGWGASIIERSCFQAALALLPHRHPDRWTVLRCASGRRLRYS